MTSERTEVSRTRISPATLRRFSLLASLDEARLQELTRELSTHRMPRQTPIVRKGDTDQSIYFLFEGKLKVVDFTETGRELGLAFLSPGAHFGEMALIEEAPRSASVVAVTESLVLELPSQHARRLLFGEPTVARFIMQRLAEIIRRDNERRALLGSPHAYQRIYSFLLSLATRAETGDEWVVERLPTQEDIAAMTDTSRETVSRALAVLRNRKIAQKDREDLSRLAADQQ